MKPLAALLLLLLAPATFAASPTRDQLAAQRREEVASFIARVSYAKENADPVIYDTKGGVLSCIVYTVKQSGPKNPAYTVVIATDQSFAPMDDIAVVCDTVAIDPAHYIRCSGHVLSVQSGWITEGGEGMVFQLGLAKGERVLKFTGPRKTRPL